MLINRADLFSIMLMLLGISSSSSAQGPWTVEIQSASGLHSLTSITLFMAFVLLLVSSLLMRYQAGRKRVSSPEQKQDMVWSVSLLSGALLCILLMVAVHLGIGLLYPGIF